MTEREDGVNAGASSQHEPAVRGRWLSKNVVAVGLVSLLTDAASEMVLPLLPAFLTLVLHAGPLALAWVEGLADATASVLKLVSGRWADRIGRRRPFMFAGYGLSSTVRPLVALATAAWHVVAIRVLDRVGKGLRSSPRDALLAASVHADDRGIAFGFHRALDHAGAVIGPLAAVAIMTWWTDDLRTIFWLAAIPGALAVLAIAIGVREVAPPSQPSARTIALLPDERRRLRRALIPLSVFALGNASDAFLLLYAGGSDVPLVGLPLLWIALHVVKSVTAPLGGRLGDRFGHRNIIAIGFFVYAATYLGFAATADPRIIAALFVVYGLYHGLTEAPERALVAQCVAPAVRATAFGLYHLLVGLLALPASLLFAWVWTHASSSLAFMVGAGLAIVAIPLVLVLAPPRDAAVSV